MAREMNNLGGWPIPRPVLTRAFNRVGDALEKGFGRHAPNETERRIVDVETLFGDPIFKTDRLLTGQHSHRNTKRHNVFSRHETIRQRVNKRPLPKLSNTYFSLSRKGLTRRWFAPIPAPGWPLGRCATPTFSPMET